MTLVLILLAVPALLVFVAFLFTLWTARKVVAALPPQGDAWRRGLAALDVAARQAHGERFHDLTPDRQDGLLCRMQNGELAGPEWGGMPSKLFFEHRVIPDITHAYYAHPVAWNEIGFGGPASPRGYVRMDYDERPDTLVVQDTRDRRKFRFADGEGRFYGEQWFVSKHGDTLDLFNLAGRTSVLNNVLVGRFSRTPWWRSLLAMPTAADRELAFEALEADGH